MKGDRGRCLEMRLAERPGHNVKWPRLMAVMKVNLMGLKADAWKHLASLCLVVSERRMPLAWRGWERVNEG